MAGNLMLPVYGEVMKIICPKCSGKLTISPDTLIGMFVVCENCGHLFRWQSNLLSDSGKEKSPFQGDGVKHPSHKKKKKRRNQ
ncbi:MAG: hypothetical protein AB7T22_08385 [Calditrichaceae bacterium]